MKDYITIIGGGLAGSEAAYQIAKRGIKVKLYEMKPQKFSPAHTNKNLAEVVCSNSFKSNLDKSNSLQKFLDLIIMIWQSEIVLIKLITLFIRFGATEPI